MPIPNSACSPGYYSAAPSTPALLLLPPCGQSDRLLARDVPPRPPQALRRAARRTRHERAAAPARLHLSGGERRRTEIARALAAQPEFLLLDEPFAGVDPIAVHEIKSIVKRLADAGIGVLITDHNVRDTLEITHRSYIIRLGKIMVSGTRAEVLENQLARM